MHTHIQNIQKKWMQAYILNNQLMVKIGRWLVTHKQVKRV